jgi:glyoxylase-like metal-dependent hydrolase (beta-lactamase superfamily II)
VVVPFVERYGEDATRDDEYAGNLMLRYGIPEEIVVALRSVSASFRAWGASANVTRPLADGELISLRDRTLEVQHRPGHSPSDTLFWDERRRILLCADHLIAHISSNPLLSRPLDGSHDRPKALVAYLRSLALTRELPAEILLPGHGEPITDHVALIDERFNMHRRRAEKLRGLIAERPRTAYELAQEMWGNVAVTQAFLTLSEVVGHVDLLIDAGLVDEVAEDQVITFEPTGSAGGVTIPP